MNDKIKELQAQIKAEEVKIRNCNHAYGEAVYNPEIVVEPYGYKTVGQGSDVWTEPQGFHEVSKQRWSRKCSKCGNEQFTYKQEAVAIDYKPSFN